MKYFTYLKGLRKKPKRSLEFIAFKDKYSWKWLKLYMISLTISFFPLIYDFTLEKNKNKNKK